MQIKDLKKKKDVYEFTVHYTEYKPTWGSKKRPNTSWCHLPSNAQIYIENFKVELYKRVMEKHLGGSTERQTKLSILSQVYL